MHRNTTYLIVLNIRPYNSTQLLKYFDYYTNKLPEYNNEQKLRNVHSKSVPFFTDLNYIQL